MLKRLWLIVPWALFLLIALGWTGYWFYVADAAERSIAQWRDEQRQTGAQVEYASIRRHGFPVLMRLELVDVAYTPARMRWRATTPSLDLNLEMLNPRHAILQARQPITIAKEDGSTETLRAQAILASVRMQGGTLAQAGIEADALVYDDAKPGELTIRKLVINLRPDPRAADQYQISLLVDAMRLARPVRSFEQFGQEVSSIRGAVVIEQGAALFQRAPDDFLRPWREAGGRARIEGLELNWGPLQGRGEGFAATDDQRRLTGQLDLHVEHPGPPLRALAQAEPLSRNERQLLDAIGRGLELSGREVTFKVIARDGVMKVEDVAVRTLAPLY